MIVKIPLILVFVGSGHFKVDVQISTSLPSILAIGGKQITLSFKRMKKACFRCFELDYMVRACKKDKASLKQFMELHQLMEPKKAAAKNQTKSIAQKIFRVRKQKQTTSKRLRN